jgi:hypothetical protein
VRILTDKTFTVAQYMQNNLLNLGWRALRSMAQKKSDAILRKASVTSSEGQHASAKKR